MHTWIRGYLRRADQNQDGKMSYDEVKHLLQLINIDLNEQYARTLFKVRVREQQLSYKLKEFNLNEASSNLSLFYSSSCL